jgi:hypothetical protein
MTPARQVNLGEMRKSGVRDVLAFPMPDAATMSKPTFPQRWKGWDRAVSITIERPPLFFSEIAFWEG